MAYRVGWGGGSIRIATLDSNFAVVDDQPVILRHSHCSFACEDPRLFVHRDKLHVSFCGVERIAGFWGIHVLYSPLSKTFEGTAITYPHFAKRARAEKNWVFFSDAQQLYAVYGSQPVHSVLRIDRNAILVASTKTPSVWQSGFIRGGAPPVLHEGEWWHWFHGHQVRGSHVTYSVGLLTFERYPPFRVTRITQLPLLASDRSTNPRLPAWELKSIIFPAGAYFDSGKWVVSYGLHDVFCEVATFDHEDVEARLVPV